jgi:DNA-binding response OmpR family regulator
MRRCGADLIVGKPFRLDELLETVGGLLRPPPSS